jgi:hypothetical protein
MTTPSREDIIEMVATHMYRGRIVNNAHRGDLDAGCRLVWHNDIATNNGFGVADGSLTY